MKTARMVGAASLAVLALFATACEPDDGSAGSAAGAGTATSATASASATAPATASGSESASPSAVPMPSSTPEQPRSSPAHESPTTVRKPEPAPSSTAADEPEAAKAAGSCGSHTTGTCGWDAGRTPVSQSEMAECNDGSVSTSATPQGTCSHHKGVRYWFK
ncbi:hypothetical protein ACFC1R_12640 [Kitasatospora sp. NPDC056138]|uniref:hypothetical protein n=1 Tax=Kitasatospora sp. NPDC056138 TaxID=3345724 RepID=UPI0035D675D6